MIYLGSEPGAGPNATPTKRPITGRWWHLWLLLTVLLASAPPVESAESVEPFRLEFLGDAYLPLEIRIGESQVGGLSGIVWSRRGSEFLAVSDDPGYRGPARFYRIEIELTGSRLATDGAEVTEVIVLKDAAGHPWSTTDMDPEGIALIPGKALFIASEGQIRAGGPPALRQFDEHGNLVREFTIPKRYFDAERRDFGMRHNRAFESLTLTPDYRFLITATENALIQDGPAPSAEERSPCRILILDVESGAVVAEHIYWTEPVAVGSETEPGEEKAGLVDLLSLGRERLIAVERSYSPGQGNTIRMFLVDLDDATDIEGLVTAGERDLSAVVPAAKTLLLDFEDLEIELDNIEGIGFGPELNDGRRSLILVGDDNFNPAMQRTQFLAFALSEERPTIAAIQGAAHRSPFVGQWVRGLAGRVEGLNQEREIWISSLQPDSDPATSEGLRVRFVDSRPPVEIGDRVVVGGRVAEMGESGELTVTTLMASTARVDGSVESALSTLYRVGDQVPAEVIDDDGTRYFDPQFDGADFWESLEGMRVELRDPVVVGPTGRFGDIVVVADRGQWATSRTRRGGLRLRPGDPNPERLTLAMIGDGDPIEANVGDRFDGSVSGVIDYDHGVFVLRVSDPLPPMNRAAIVPKPTRLEAGRDHLTLASLNAWNLGPTTAQARVEKLARLTVNQLRSPDLLAVQEIQDDSGPQDDGVVSAVQTLERWITAIESAGGPRYAVRQIDPVDGVEGGYPGANIRVAFLFNPRRLRVVDRGEGGASVPARVVSLADGAGLDPSPGRVAPRHGAFQGEPERFGGSRPCLVAQFEFRGQPVFAVNCHLASKRSDTGLFGSEQPPLRRSEDQRSQQTRLLRDFVAEILALDAEAAVVVVGDLNDHEFRPPLRILEGSGLTNLIERVPLPDRYTFNYRGNSQVLDHVFVSPAVVEAAQIEIVHANADFASAEAASDHDPVVVRIDFSAVDD